MKQMESNDDIDWLQSPQYLFTTTTKDTAASPEPEKNSKPSKTSRPYTMSGKFYIAVFRSNDGRPCISNGLYRNEEEARKELGKDFLGLYNHVDPFEYWFKG